MMAIMADGRELPLVLEDKADSVPARGLGGVFIDAWTLAITLDGKTTYSHVPKIAGEPSERISERRFVIDSVALYALGVRETRDAWGNVLIYGADLPRPAFAAVAR